MGSVIKSLCIFILSLICCRSKDLPSFIQKCKLEYPQVNQCILQRVDDLKPYLEKGIPELKIPALKPLLVPKAEIQTGNETSAGFRATFTDIVVVGGEAFQLTKLDFNLEKQIVHMHIYIPKLHCHSNYTFKGKILILELSGTGPADTNITNINSKVHSNIKKVVKNGKLYIGVEDSIPTISYDQPSVRFEDLFRGNKELTERTNQVINENIEEIQNEVKPLIDDIVHGFVYGIITRIFDEYSIDELFD